MQKMSELRIVWVLLIHSFKLLSGVINRKAIINDVCAMRIHHFPDVSCENILCTTGNQMY